MSASYYRIDGLVERRLEGRMSVRLRYIGWCGETTAKAYSARLYADGHCQFLVNSTIVEALPNTPIAREVMSRLLDLSPSMVPEA